MKRSDQEAIAELLHSDPEEALACVKELRGDYRDDPDILAFEAECRGELGEFDGALRLWARYIEVDPDYMAAYTERCRFFTELGRFDAAAAEANLCDELFGEQPGSASARAFLKEAMGDLDAADAEYARAARLDPDEVVPPRFSAANVQTLLEAALDGAGGVEVAAMPKEAGDEGYGRAFDVSADTRVVVYQRNVERSLEEGSDINAFVSVVQELWESLAQA